MLVDCSIPIRTVDFSRICEKFEGRTMYEVFDVDHLLRYLLDETNIHLDYIFFDYVHSKSVKLHKHSQSSFMGFYEIVTAHFKLNEEKQRWDKGNDKTSIPLSFKITDRTF